MEISGKTLITLLQHSRKMAHLLNKGESARGRFGAVSALPHRRVPTLRFPSDAPATLWGPGWGERVALLSGISTRHMQMASGHFRGSYEVRGVPQSRSESSEISQSPPVHPSPPPRPCVGPDPSLSERRPVVFPQLPKSEKMSMFKGN